MTTHTPEAALAAAMVKLDLTRGASLAAPEVYGEEAVAIAAFLPPGWCGHDNEASPVNPYRSDTTSWVAFEQGVMAQRLLMGMTAAPKPIDLPRAPQDADK